MKNLKIFMLSVLLAASFGSSAWAVDAPISCPTVDFVKKAGLSMIQEDKEDSLYLAYQISRYSTTSTWAFVIGVPMDQALTKGDAMNKAKAALLTLSGEPEPLPTSKENKQWYCMYQNDYNYFAVSITPLSVSNAMVHSVFDHINFSGTARHQ